MEVLANIQMPSASFFTLAMTQSGLAESALLPGSALHIPAISVFRKREAGAQNVLYPFIIYLKIACMQLQHECGYNQNIRQPKPLKHMCGAFVRLRLRAVALLIRARVAYTTHTHAHTSRHTTNTMNLPNLQLHTHTNTHSQTMRACLVQRVTDMLLRKHTQSNVTIVLIPVAAVSHVYDCGDERAFSSNPRWCVCVCVWLATRFSIVS